jgi:hypothetical protein
MTRQDEEVLLLQKRKQKESLRLDGTGVDEIFLVPFSILIYG